MNKISFGAVKIGMYLPKYMATTYNLATSIPVSVYLPTQQQCSEFHQKMLLHMQNPTSKYKYNVLKNLSYFTDQRRLQLCDVIIDEMEAKVTYLKEENVIPGLRKLLDMIEKSKDKKK